MNALEPVAPGDPRALELLARIEAHGFNAADDPLGFESRLADDNGWTLGYALAVTEEYRRFLVLTQVAGQAVSPSPDVDEAWHLHLTRTAHYTAFCNSLLGKFLHHEPARAGEGERHRDMYRETLAAYRRAFGFGAPSVLWPQPGRPVAPQVRADAGWPVPDSLRRGHRLAVACVLLPVVAGSMLLRLGWLDPLQSIGPVAFLAAALLCLVVLGWRGLRDGMPAPSATARDRLEPYEAAWFAGRAERMAMTAIVALTERGVLRAPGKPTDGGARPPMPVDRTIEVRCVHPAEAACLRAATDEGLRYPAACRAMLPLADEVEHRLVVAGVAGDRGTLPLRRARALLGLVVLLTVESERILHAFAAGHRAGFLVLLTLAGAGLAVVLARRAPRANARAERVLRPLRTAAGRHRKSTPTGQALAFGVALVGGAAMAADDLRFDGLKQQVNAQPLGYASRRGGKDDGSGCSSSSCSSCSSDGGSGGGSSCGSSCGSGCGGGGD